MKKKWIEPQILVQEFVPNEYVAACRESGVVYKFDCNAGIKNHKYAVKDANGNVATIAGRYMNGGKYYGGGFFNPKYGKYYHPCGEKHEAEADSGFLRGYHIDDMSTEEDDNISVIIWTNNNTNVHCTTNLNMNEWTTAKS